MLRYRTRKPGEKPAPELDHFSLQSRPSSSPVRSGQANEGHRAPISPDTTVSRTSSSQDLPASTTESSWDLYGLTPVQTRRDDIQTAHQKQQAAVNDAKQKVSTLRRIFARLGFKTGGNDDKAASNGAVSNGAAPKGQNRSQQPTLDQQLANSQAYKAVTPQNGLQKTDGFPIPMALNGGPNNQLVLRRSLPPGVTEDYEPPMRYTNTHMKLLPPISPTNEFGSSVDHRLSSVLVSRRTMDDELEATQQKLNQLFNSQAMLRERYDLEKNRSLNLDAEYQRTHTRIHSLEQSTRQMDDELKRLHEYVSSLEKANRQLRDDLQAAEIERPNQYLDVGLPSPKLSIIIPPIPEIQPLKPKPPPIPRKADRRSTRRGDESSSSDSPSKSTLKPVDSNEDKSFWRVGDITTIAAAVETAPRFLAHKRRSVSMSESILRRGKDETSGHGGEFKRPSSARSNSTPPRLVAHARLLEPQTARESAQGPFSVYATPLLGSSQKQLSLSPAQRKGSAVPPLPRAGAAAAAAVAVAAAAVAASQKPANVPGKPVNPQRKPGVTFPETYQRKPSGSFPANPQRQPSGTFQRPPGESPRQKSVRRAETPPAAAATYARPMWPQPQNMDTRASPPPQPLPQPPPDFAGPSTSRGKAPMMQPMVQPNLAVDDHLLKPGSRGTSQDFTEHSDSKAPSTSIYSSASGSGSGSRARRLKLKSSLELLPNCGKKEVTANAHRHSAIQGVAVSPISSLLHDRGFSLYQFVNPMPVEQDMISYDLEKLTPSIQTSAVMTSTPTPMRVTFPRHMRGIEGSIGMYDSVSDMWLTPQSMKSDHQQVTRLKQGVAGAFSR